MSEKKLINKYENSIDTLISSDKRLVFLVGAGISIDPPTNLIPATQFIRYLLELCAPEEEIKNLIAIKSLRYEMIAEIIQRYIDYDLDFMNYIELITQPNLNHFFLANLIRKGHSIYTTNFDYLIEYALKEIMDKEEISNIFPVITKNDFIQYQNPYDTYQNGKYPVYKLHGAKKNIITKINTTESLVTTMSAFGKGNKFLSLEPYKKKSFLEVCKNNILIVMGYSGRDDFDIAPMLRQLFNIKKLIWIDHQLNDSIEIFNFNPKQAFVIPKNLSRIERLLAEISSNTEAEVYMIKTNTGQLIKNVLWPLLLSDTKLVELPSSEIKDVESPISFKKYLDEKFTKIPPLIKWKCTSDIYLELGLIKDFLHCTEAGLEKARSAESERMESEFLNLLGIYYYNQKDYNKSLQYYEEALKIDEKSKNLPFQAVRLNNIGLIHLEKETFDKALEYFNKALEIGKMRGDYRGMGARINNIGLIYLKQKDYERAIDNFQEALKLDKKIGNLSGRSIRLKNIGDVYKAQKNYLEALEKYRNSYQIIQKLEDRVGLGKILTEIGKIYSELKDYGKAITNLKKAINYLEEIEDIINLNEAKKALKEVKKNLE